MRSPTRAAVVGLGMMGRHHTRVLRQIENVQLVACADPRGDPHRCTEDVPVVPAVERLLDYDIDYCVIAVPTTTHCEVALELAAAKVPCLIEKPLAANLREAVQIAEAFEAAGVPAGVGHTERYNPALIEMRKRLGQNDLGTVYQIATRRTGPFPPRVSGVGAITDLATHDIDLATWTTGQLVTSVTAQTTARSGNQHEDLVAAVGVLTNRTIISHLVNWLSPMKERVTIATGEGGCLVADTLQADLTYYANGSTTTEWLAAEVFRGVTEGDVTRYAIPKKEPLAAQHEAFRDHLNGHNNEIVPLWHGAQTIAVAEAMLRSATTGQSVRPSYPTRRFRDLSLDAQPATVDAADPQLDGG